MDGASEPQRRRLLAVIPARGGSKGLPGKHLRPFAGLPLIGHSIRCATLCPVIDRCIVTTDSPRIAEVARQLGGDVPFLRPAELAQDQTPMWPVLRHALDAVESEEAVRYDELLLLDPTSPVREPSDVPKALQRLRQCPEADGIIGVSQPDANPIWHCVIERDGWMADLMAEGSTFEYRQEVPTVYEINGSLYLWRAEFVRRETRSWRRGGRHVLYELSHAPAVSIDTLDQFERAEALVKSGLVTLPWLQPDRALRAKEGAGSR